MTSARPSLRARTARRLPSLMALVVICFLTAVPPASAAVSCSKTGAAITISSNSGDSFTISRDLAGNLTGAATGGTCTGSTVTNTDSIAVTTTGSSGQTLTIDMTNGRFEPGMTAEGTGTSEIEFTVNLGGGTDTINITGTSGVDTIVFGASGINLNADEATDDADDLTLTSVDNRTVNGAAGSDVISGAGGEGTGTVFTSPLTLNGGDDADMLTGGSNEDILSGGAGDDTLNGGADDDTLNGGTEADTLNGDAGNDTLNGGTGNDTLNGGAGDDDENGEDGDDTFNQEAASNGEDTLDGGNGTADHANYSARTLPLLIDIDNNNDDGDIATDEDDNVETDVENVTGGSAGDTITGSTSANALVGGAGNDTLNGGLGTTAGDSLTGDAGNDIASYLNVAAAVTVNLSIVGPQDTGGAGIDTITTVENLTGTAFGDTLTGDGGNNVIRPGDGLDTADGAGGLDDTIAYDNLTGPAIVDLSASPQTGLAAGETDILSNFERAIGTNASGDVLTGSSGNNQLDGRNGNDTLNGGAGNDLLLGGLGNDTIDGGLGTDSVNYSAAPSGVTVNLAGAAPQATGGHGSDTITNVEDVVGSNFADTITGTAVKNNLNGLNGNDVINGGDGNDFLRGQGNDDTLNGGNGNDFMDGGLDTDTCNGDAGTGDSAVNCETVTGVP